MGLNKLLIATGNSGKVVEFQNYFYNTPIKCISLKGFNLPEPEENGNSFEDNALIKSSYYSKNTALTALSDDSGLSIDQLDGNPGILSARWAGKNKDFSIAIKKVESQLRNRNISLQNITGYFYCALSLFSPNGENIFFTGKVPGKIVFPPRGNKGFGYDPIFIPNGHNVTFGEMDSTKKNQLSHRTIALEKLKKYIQTL